MGMHLQVNEQASQSQPLIMSLSFVMILSSYNLFVHYQLKMKVWPEVGKCQNSVENECLAESWKMSKR